MRRGITMASFYGVELTEECSRPMDVSEIMSLPSHVQDWVLMQLARWVREHGGNLYELLTDASTQWAKSVIKKAWGATEDIAVSNDEVKAPMRTGKRIAVTSAQVMAARIQVGWLRGNGEPIPPKLWKIANARRQDGTPIRIGRLNLDEPFLTPEEIASTEPELGDEIRAAVDSMIEILER